MKYNLIIKNQTDVSIEFLLLSNETKKEFKGQILNILKKLFHMKKKVLLDFQKWVDLRKVH